MSAVCERHAISDQEQCAIVLGHTLADGRQNVVGTLPIAGDDEHPKRLPPVLPRVLPVVLCGGVGEKFPLETGLHEVPAIDRHGAAITLDEEGAEPAIRVADGEDMVGSNTEVVHAVVAVDLRAHHPRPLASLRFLRSALQKKLRVQQLKAGSLPDRALQCNPHVRDRQRVLDELPAGEIVLAGPIHLGGVDAVVDEKSRSAIAERVHHRR